MTLNVTAYPEEEEHFETIDPSLTDPALLNAMIKANDFEGLCRAFRTSVSMTLQPEDSVGIMQGGILTEAVIEPKSCLTDWIERLTRGLIGETKSSYGTFVIQRKTGEVTYEEMPLYVRIGMHMVFVGRAQSKIVNAGALDRPFKIETLRQGKHFDSPASVDHIGPFIRSYKLKTDELLEPDLSKYPTFNAFFYRKLRPGVRPIDGAEDQQVIVSPADARTVVFPSVKAATNLWIKGKKFTVASLLGSEETAKAFEGGSIAVFRLAPQDYHRYHSPVEVREVEVAAEVEGSYYTVNPQAVNQDIDVFTRNTRRVWILHSPTEEEERKVAFVAIGALLVGSVILTATGPVAKGEEVGYFAYGGSTIVCLWPKGTMVFDKDLLKNTQTGKETLLRMGEQIGRYVPE